MGIFVSASQNTSIVFKNITIDEGLSQNSVVSIAQDSLGFIWFATQDGLNRFDGVNFKIYPRSFDDVTNPDYSRLGQLQIYGNNLWMVTRGGRLEVLSLLTDKFKHVSRLGGMAKDLPQVRSLLVESRNKIWIGTEQDGLYLVDRQMNVLRHYSTSDAGSSAILSNRINQIYKNSEGALFVLSDKGINEINHNRISVVLEDVMANVLTEDSFGNLYAGSQKKGVFIRMWQTKKFQHMNRDARTPFPTDLSVKSLFIDDNGLLWIGTYGNGLYLLDRRVSKLTHFTPERDDPGSIGYQDILKVYQDNQGGMWFGTDGGGVSFYDESFGNFKVLANHNVPETVAVEQIRAITTEKDGVIWIGTSGYGYTRVDTKNNTFNTFHIKPYKAGLKNFNRIVALHSDGSGDLWIGTHGNGTLIRDGKTGEIKKWMTKDAIGETEKISDNTIWTFEPEGAETVWAGSRSSGLFLIDKTKGVIKQFNDGDQSPDNLQAIERINDSILALGFGRKGVRLLNTKRGKYQRLVPEYFIEELDHVEIKSLYYLNGWLWVGTGGKGIVAVELKSCRIRRFTEEDGLPNNMIYGILEEDSRTIWFSTNRGLARLTYKKENEDIKIDKVTSFDSKNGLQSNEFNTGAFHKGLDGMLFFGGVKGLNYFDPQTMPDRKEKIPIVISEARIDNLPYKGERSILYEDLLKLNLGENSVAVNYQALHYVSPERLAYTYKLEGYDQDWIMAGSRNYTAYTNLPPGNYIFRVKLAENVLDHAPVTSLGISVATPFWQTWWFIFLIILILLSILYGIYRVRINQFLELQKVKDSISADLHDDLGSRLTTIHLLSALSRSKFETNPELGKLLSNIDREVYASSEALDEIVWNIKKTNESLTDIVAKIRRYSSEVLESANIAYHIDTSEDFEPFELSIKKRRELFLICKELINNIRKHAAASKVILTIGKDKKRLYVSVSDDGKGFDPNQKTHRNGISNLKTRVENWNGEIQITSGPEKGCFIELWIPFDKTNMFHKIFRR